ncbi:MAG: hypothetical protein RL071_1911 [Pseudomonadota bacterium]
MTLHLITVLFFFDAQAAGWEVAPQRPCNLRAAPSDASRAVGYIKPGVVVSAASVTPDGWVSVAQGTKTGWLGPECKWEAMAVEEPAPAVVEAPTPECPVCPELPPPPPPPVVDEQRASYGGVFLGRSATTDAYLGQGGQLSVGGLALLRVEDSAWFTGLSAAYLGGSRFERQVIPFAPGIGAGGAGIGNVASIYTDVRHIPIASVTGYGWELWRMELLAAAGPSAHRFSVLRREQVSGVSQQRGAEGPSGKQQTELTTYTVDRKFTGDSSKWALGATAMAGAVFDVGDMPFVKGRWSMGIFGMASTPLGRQGCGTDDDNDPGFGTVCVPLQIEETRRSYYTQGKEDTDRIQSTDSDPLLPVRGLTWSVNSTLLFQF